MLNQGSVAQAMNTAAKTMPAEVRLVSDFSITVGLYAGTPHAVCEEG